MFSVERLISAASPYEQVPKFGLHEGIHKIGTYPRSESTIHSGIPSKYRRGTSLYISSALILGHVKIKLPPGNYQGEAIKKGGRP